MEVVHTRCCGIDVHRDTVAACLLTERGREMRSFKTTTEELYSLAAWLNQANCTAAAMESTGVYWKPVYNILELTGVELMVVNARHIKAVPGRKTDVKDAEWIADLLRHGLLRGSFIPDRPQRELQELVRYRRSLLHERTREVNRLHKVLHGANINLSGVLTDIMGASGRDILTSLAGGETDPDKLLTYIRPNVKASRKEIRAALQGLVAGHQPRMLTAQLAHVDAINQEIAGLDDEIERRLAPDEATISRLDTVPGIGRIGAQEIIAAIGTDMTRFPTSAHLASWAKVCPGTNESAGKRKPARTGKGSPYLRATLIEAARAAARCEKTYLAARYRQLKARRGTQKAAVAVAHTILVIAYHIIKDNTTYQDVGIIRLETQRSEAVARQLVRQLERMGKVVILKDSDS